MTPADSGAAGQPAKTGSPKPGQASQAVPRLSVVIPSYNESRRLPDTLEKIQAFLEERDWPWEVVVSDDGSTDGTPELVRDRFPGCLVVAAGRNEGKGAAVRRGMLKASGELRLFSDADLSTPIEEAVGMMQAMEEGNHDVVIASRALPGSELVVRQPWWREMSGRAFNQLVRPISGLPFHDTQCGFKLFRAEAAERLFAGQASSGWAFDVELLMLAQALGYRVLEHPVRWINSEASKVNMLRDAPRMLGDIMAFRWRLWRGRTGA